MNRSPEHSSLREKVLEHLTEAALCLMGPPGSEDAFHATVDDLPGLALERIPKRSLTDAVFDQLVARIVSGRLAPGQALPP